MGCGGSQESSGKPTKFDVEKQVARIKELKKTSECIGIQQFDEEYFNTLTDDQKQQLLRCVNSGVENPDSQVGVYAMRPNDYDEFKPFFKKVLESYHKVDLNTTKHVNSWDISGAEGLPENGQLNLADLGLPELSMRVRTGRNLRK